MGTHQPDTSNGYPKHEELETIIPELSSNDNDELVYYIHFNIIEVIHYENTAIQIYWKFYHQNIKKIHIKILIFFKFLFKTKIVCTR